MVSRLKAIIINQAAAKKETVWDVLPATDCFGKGNTTTNLTSGDWRAANRYLKNTGFNRNTRLKTFVQKTVSKVSKLCHQLPLECIILQTR